MKKLIFLTAVGLSSLIATAQTGKGSMMLGGNLGFGSSNYKSTQTTGNVTITTNDQKSSSITILPTFGYFVADQLVVGLMAGIDNSKTVYKNPSGNVSEQTYQYNNTVIGLFARKYFMPTTTFGMYGGLQFMNGPSKNTIETVYNNNNPTTTVETKGSYTTVGLEGGVAFFPSNKFGMHLGVAGLGWQSSKSESENSGTKYESKSSGFNFDLNTLYLNVGLFYFFGGGE